MIRDADALPWSGEDLLGPRDRHVRLSKLRTILRIVAICLVRPLLICSRRSLFAPLSFFGALALLPGDDFCEGTSDSPSLMDGKSIKYLDFPCVQIGLPLSFPHPSLFLYL